MGKRAQIWGLIAVATVGCGILWRTHHGGAKAVLDRIAALNSGEDAAQQSGSSNSQQTGSPKIDNWAAGNSAAHERLLKPTPQQVAPIAASSNSVRGFAAVPEFVLFDRTNLTGNFVQEAYTRQIGSITINSNILRQTDTALKQSALVLNLFPNAAYTAAVEKVERDLNGVLTISGRIAGQQISTFTLSEKDGIAVADLTDMAAGRVFKIKYSAPMGQHVVIEYDPTNMPARYDGHVVR
jgi:hypothetical protein